MRAFTLVEVLVSLLILSVVLAGVYAVFNIGNTSYLIDISLMRLQQDARQGMQALVKELRNSNNIAVTALDANNDKITFNTYSGSGISYYRDLSDANADGVTTQIIREYPLGTRKVIASNITRLKFTYANHIVITDITASSTVRRRALSYPLKSQVRIRNER